MFRAAYEYYDLDWVYDLYPCKNNDEFHRFWAQLTQDDSVCIGLNVTMPYKREAATAVLTSRGKLLGAAADIKALNVVSWDTCGTLRGYNFDGDGLVASLLANSVALKDAHVLICGTGAVTAATCWALAGAGVASITVASRLCQRAVDFTDELSTSMREHNDHPPVTLAGIDYANAAALNAALQHATLLVDATPTGMHINSTTLLPTNLLTAQHTVVDVVYGHGETQLIKAARNVGATAMDGLGMLVEQAVLTFMTWIAREDVDVHVDARKVADIMNRAARAELQHRTLKAN
jgi:shikimate dehydrogenase